MPNYKTNYASFLKELSNGLFSLLTGSWRKRSIALLSLLSGFYFASFLLAYLVTRTGYRVFVVIIIVLFVELLIRARNYIFTKRPSIEMVRYGLDNLRIGITYAIVLEAFKLGS